MSPEQVRGASSVDHRADLYSLGMCLFHMLTGEFAYYSANHGDILVGICTLPLPKLREKAPWLPESVEQWFQRACAKEPLERFQSADEMTEALQATGAASPSPMSKHQSVPEGRIAPETLVGFAAPPALATMHSDAAQLSLARTQALSPGPSPMPGGVTAPIAIVTHAEPRAVTGDEWVPPPRRNFVPWVVGAGIGLFALALLGLTLRFTSRDAPASATAMPSANGKVPADRVPASLPPAVTEAEAAPEPARAPAPGSVSSVAAQSAPSAVGPSRAETPKRRQKADATVAPAAPPSKAPGSDLGF
jgi:serine/threonine-protein kinase